MIYPNEAELRKLVSESISSLSFDELIVHPEVLKLVLELIQKKAKELKFNGLEVPK